MFFEYIKVFSDNYANAISALASLSTFIVTLLAFNFLKREFAAKYRPYVVTVIKIDSVKEGEALGYSISIIPRNVGSHPCEIKLTNIKLHIGDEVYETPNNKEWVLLGGSDIELRVPAGYINTIGVNKVREARYKNNRVEVNFVISTRSVERKFEDSKEVGFEINVLSEQPYSVFRAEWHKPI